MNFVFLCLPCLFFFPYNGQSQIWGANIHFTNPQAGELSQLGQAFKITRMDFFWSHIETTKGVYNWSAYDSLLNNLETNKIRSLWILDFSNALYDDGLSPYTSTGITAFCNFAVASVDHFKGHNIIWEMWNEPDNDIFWTPHANATAYAALANAVGEALNQAGLESETYIGPTTGWFDWNYIEAVFAAGVLKYFDIVSIHPYRNENPETALADYTQLRSLIAKYNPSKPQDIFASEWGYTCCGPCDSIYYEVAYTTQGKYLPRQWLVNTIAGVKLSIYYDWKNDGNSPTQSEYNFGSVLNAYQNSSEPYQPKDNYNSAKTLQATLPPASFTYRSRIDATVNGVVDSNAYVLSFTKTGTSTVAGYAVWKTSISQTCPNIPHANRQECGFHEISEDECVNKRKCCFEDPYVGPGPQCYLQETSATLTFSASASGSTCFRVINYLGANVTSNLCPNNGILTVTASDGH